MSRPTGAGRTEIRPVPPSLMLYNFDIDGDQLKAEHEAFLRAQVIPTLRSSGSVSILGFASRSGLDAHNQVTSERRVASTVAFLRREVPNGFNVRQMTGFGERVAAREGYRDGTEDERFRAVLLFLSSSPTPPSVPNSQNLPSLLPDMPPPGDSVLDTVGKILDVIGGVSGPLEIIASGVFATALDVMGAAAGILSALLALPAAWWTADRLAHFNGRYQGYWNAMQDMARPLSVPGLDQRPESEWPPVLLPRPHLSDVTESTSSAAVLEWRRGERDGCPEAYRMIQEMDRRPVNQTVNTGGVQRRVRVSGRMMLRLIWIARRGDVVGFTRDELNRRLRAHGNRGWPLLR